MYIEFAGRILRAERIIRVVKENRSSLLFYGIENPCCHIEHEISKHLS